MKLSPAEAKAAAEEILRKAKVKREKEERELERLREQERIRSGKELLVRSFCPSISLPSFHTQNRHTLRAGDIRSGNDLLLALPFPSFPSSCMRTGRACPILCRHQIQHPPHNTNSEHTYKIR